MCVAGVEHLLTRGTAQDADDLTRLSALLTTRSALQTDILEARAGLELSFDDINRSLRALRAVSHEAARARERGRPYAQAAEALTRCSDALQIEEAATETFKSDLALLRLSSRNFPRVADELQRRLASVDRESAPSRDPALAPMLQALAALRTNLEHYEASPSRETTHRLESSIAAVDALRQTLDPDDTLQGETAVLLGHTRVILERRERVDRFTRNLARSAVATHLEAARSAYELATRAPLARIIALRIVASELAALGLAAFATAAWLTSRNRRALKRAHASS
jgi:hypothetical protein